MKKLVVVFIFFGLTSASQAQFLKDLGKKAEKALERTVEKRTEQEVEEQTNKTIDAALEGHESQEQKENHDSQPSTTNQDGTSKHHKVAYQDTYTFPVTVTMLFEDLKGKKESSSVVQSMSKDALMITDPKESQFTIMDFNTQTSIVLNSKTMTGQAMSLAFMKQMDHADDASPSTEMETPQVTKTGRSKKIAGYLSYEYQMTSEDGNMLLWFTKDIAFTMADYLSGMMTMFGKKHKASLSQDMWSSYGFIMEMEQFDKRGHIESRMTVTELSEEPQSISLSRYHIQKLSF